MTRLSYVKQNLFGLPSQMWSFTVS